MISSVRERREVSASVERTWVAGRVRAGVWVGGAVQRTVRVPGGGERRGSGRQEAAEGRWVCCGRSREDERVTVAIPQGTWKGSVPLRLFGVTATTQNTHDVCVCTLPWKGAGPGPRCPGPAPPPRSSGLQSAGAAASCSPCREGGLCRDGSACLHARSSVIFLGF